MPIDEDPSHEVRHDPQRPFGARRRSADHPASLATSLVDAPAAG